MALIIALNAILSVGIVVAVASPLVWAIFTQHRDHRALAPAIAFGPNPLTHKTRTTRQPARAATPSRRPEFARA